MHDVICLSHDMPLIWLHERINDGIKRLKVSEVGPPRPGGKLNYHAHQLIYL